MVENVRNSHFLQKLHTVEKGECGPLALVKHTTQSQNRQLSNIYLKSYPSFQKCLNGSIHCGISRSCSDFSIRAYEDQGAYSLTLAERNL